MKRGSAYKKVVRVYEQFTCQACKRTWFSALKHPKRCGKCKSPYWDVPRKTEEPPKAELTA